MSYLDDIMHKGTIELFSKVLWGLHFMMTEQGSEYFDPTKGFEMKTFGSLQDTMQMYIVMLITL
jgi:hypothetical protein